MEKNIMFGMVITIVIALIAGGVGYYIGTIENQYGALTEYNELTLENYEIYQNITDSPKYYIDRFYKEGLADFLMLQLYMFPFNSSDVVTLEYGGIHNEIVYINHTVPNPEFLPMRELYNFTMNFDYEMTWQEG